MMQSILFSIFFFYVFKQRNDKVDLIRTGCGNSWIDVSNLSDSFLKIWPQRTVRHLAWPEIEVWNTRHAQHCPAKSSLYLDKRQRGQSTEWWQVKSHLSSFTLNPLVPHSLLLPPLYNRALVKLDNKEGCDRNLPKTLADCQKEELTTVLKRIPVTLRGWFERLSISHTVPQPIGIIFFFFFYTGYYCCNKWSVWVL